MRQFYAVNVIVRICLRYVYMTPDNGGVRVSWAGRLFGCLRAKTCERKALRKAKPHAGKYYEPEPKHSRENSPSEMHLTYATDNVRDTRIASGLPTREWF